MNNRNGAAPIPVGFRFHPTDEELVGYYLHGKVGRAQRDQLIQELDLYKLEPWDLHEVCRIGDDAAENQSDWYFFSHKDKKYPTGNRANRATTAGFWKATGRDKPIHTQRHVIGMRKTLVFYRGRAPHGQKTDWIMHEFRLDEGPGVVPNYESDGWVVCRVFRKTKSFKTKSQDTSCSFEDDHPHVGSAGQLLAENLMSSPLAANLYHHFNFTCKQEISVDDYGTPIHDPASFTVDSNLQHLQDLHRNIIEGTVITGHGAPLGPCSTSSSALMRRTKLDQEQSVVPALVHGDDARSSVTDEAAASGSCSFPLIVEDYWMQLEGARDNIMRLHSGGVRRDPALADVTCHIHITRQTSDQLSVSHENLVHLWNV